MNLYWVLSKCWYVLFFIYIVLCLIWRMLNGVQINYQICFKQWNVFLSKINYLVKTNSNILSLKYEYFHIVSYSQSSLPKEGKLILKMTTTIQPSLNSETLHFIFNNLVVLFSKVVYFLLFYYIIFFIFWYSDGLIRWYKG